jgi:hypothetical protein
MATIETKPLPPPNSSAITIAEAERAEMMARANAVIDYYLNGPGSYWDAGTRKPLVSDDELRDDDTTVNDLKKFKDRAIAAKQFADDPALVMDSIIALIHKTMQQIEEAARYSEGKNSIVHPPPSTNDPIDDPRVISPRASKNAALPIVFEEEQRAAPLQTASEVSGASPVRTLSRNAVSHSPPSTYVLPPSVFGFSNRSGSFGSDVADWPAALVGLSKGDAESPTSVSGAGASAAPSVPSNEFRSSNRRNFLGNASDASFPDKPSDLAGRFAALVGIDRTNLVPRAPQENGFYDDELSQPWLFRALTGRLR